MNKQEEIDYAKFAEAMDKKEMEVQLEYEKLLKEDEGKTYLDILPKEFKSFKRSIIKRNIIFHIKRLTEIVNNSPLHKGMTFTELEITRFAMFYHSNYDLAAKFLPSRNTLFESFDVDTLVKEIQLSEEERENKKKIRYELEDARSYLTQAWDTWNARTRVKAGLTAYSYEDQEGIPETGRGSLCSRFIPIKGKWLTDQTGKLTLLNPRNKKKVVLEIEQYVSEDNIYVCVNEKGKKVYLTTLVSVENSWDALFDINKEIFSGWWNKTLIWK